MAAYPRRDIQSQSNTWYGPYGARPGIERPDDEIRSDVIHAIEHDSAINPDDISVNVDRGVVTLSGEVESSEAHLAAANDARDVPGVVDVHNDLLVTNE